jgi:hypothetical protein
MSMAMRRGRRPLTCLLKIELGDLQAFDFDLGLIGFSADEIAGLTFDRSGLTDPDEAPEAPAIPVSESRDNPCRARDVRPGISSKRRRNLARHIMDSRCGIGATRRGPGGWHGRGPWVLSLNCHSAPCIAVQRGAKFGGALPQPFVCLADRSPTMWLAFSVSVSEHCQRFGNCLGLAIPARRMDYCFARLFQISARQQCGRHRARDVGLGISSKFRRA